MLGLDKPGLLPLVAIELVDDRVAWVHAYVDGLGLGHVVGAEGNPAIPTRAAAEVIATVAETLLSLDPDLRRNRGPEPTDLLLDPSGRVYATGFSGPFPVSPSMRAPRGEEGEPAVVYRLGVLLAHLVSGVAPQPASERTAHAALVRRVLIRAMARPGPVLTERYSDWLRGLLAWEPTERPPLSAVPAGLRKVAESMGGESLGPWAGVHVAMIRGDAVRRGNTPVHDERTDDPSDLARTDEILTPEALRVAGGVQTIVDAAPPPRQRRASNPTLDAVRMAAAVDSAVTTLHGRPSGLAVREPTPMRDEFVDDDPTQEAAAVPHLLQSVKAGPVRVPAKRPQMPVQVGPPPEALRERPRLPSGFLDSTPDSVEADLEPLPDRSLARIAVIAIYLMLVGVLGSVAVVLLVYLLWVPAAPADPATSPGDEPGLSDVLGDVRPPDPAISPTVTSPGAGDDTDAALAAPDPSAGAPRAPAGAERAPPPPGGGKASPRAPKQTPPPTGRDQPTEDGEDADADAARDEVEAVVAAALDPGFTVIFQAPTSTTDIRVVCGHLRDGGLGQVRLEGVRKGTCTVSGDLGGRLVRAQVPVSASATYLCFPEGQGACATR